MKMQVGIRSVLFLLLLGGYSLSSSADENYLAQEQPLSEVINQISEKYEVIITYNSRLLSNIDVVFEFRISNRRTI